MVSKEAERLNRHWEREPGDAEFGELDGAEVRVDDVEATVPMDRWPDVFVLLASGVRSRPWRGLLGF